MNATNGASNGAAANNSNGHSGSATGASNGYGKVAPLKFYVKGYAALETAAENGIARY